MEPETALIVLFGSTVVGVVAWLWSTNYLLNSMRETLLSGNAEVEGDSSSLAGKCAAVLAGGALGPVKIVEKTDDRVAFIRLNARSARRATGGEFRFVDLGRNRTRIEWAVEMPFYRTGRAILARVVVLGGFIVGAGVIPAYLVWFSRQPIREMELLWFVHAFLWSPFLGGWLYRQAGQHLRTEIDALATNLPYRGDPTKGGLHP